MIFEDLHAIDQRVTLAINSLHSTITDPVWQLFSAKKIWFIMYAVILGFFFWNLGWKRALVVMCMCILTVTCCDQLGNIVKFAVARLRPCLDDTMLSGGLHMLEGASQKYCYGFFSAHAANALGFAVCSYLGLADLLGPRFFARENKCGLTADRRRHLASVSLYKGLHLISRDVVSTRNYNAFPC